LIYGGLIYSRLENFDKDINQIIKHTCWENNQQKTITFNNFKGGILLHKNHPYSFNEYYYSTSSTLILLSGCIYNKTQLITKLRLHKTSLTSAELVYHSYNKWDQNFVKMLNGDFGILIYDTTKNRLLAYRDHLGNCPLAYTIKNNNYFFSSDTFALCKAVYNDRGIDRNYIIKWIHGDTLDYRYLPNKSVKKILPGHYLSINGEKINQKKYWYPENIKTDTSLTFNKIKKELKELILNAVKIRCDPKFTTGAHVSGGLDSSTVASIARQEYSHQNQFCGFTWTVKEADAKNVRIDERKLVNDVCKKANITPKYFTNTIENYQEYNDDWRIPTYMFEEVSTRNDAVKAGVNLLFSGWGGDEFISINSRGVDSDLLFRFQWLSFLKKNRTKNPLRLASIILNNVLLPAFYKKVYKSSEDFDILKYFNLPKKEKKALKGDSLSYRSRRDVHLKLLYGYHLSDRTEDWTVNGYRKGIEYRYPLLDHRIVEYMLKVPSKLLFRNGYARIILREIGDGIIPESVRWHNTKFDEIKYKADKRILEPFCLKILNKKDELKSNPELNFINFDLLFKDAKESIENNNENYVSQHTYLVLAVYKMHKFIRNFENE